VRGHDAGDFTDDRKTLPLFNMGSIITFSRAEIEAYYAVRVPKLRLRASGESRGPCPIHGGEGDNFAVKGETGEWFCHSQCQRGGDILALEKELTSWDFPTCKAEVFLIVGRNGTGVHGGNCSDKEPNHRPKNSSSPQPRADSEDEESPPSALSLAAKVREGLASAGYLAAAEFRYGPSLRKVRFEHHSEKQGEKNRAKKTFRWERCVGGAWYSGDGGVPKPLYINQLFRERDQVEFAVGFEGEAKADLAGELGLVAFAFKDITAVQALTLVGCDVVLWPDNDESGVEQANKAAAIIAEAGQVRSIKLVKPSPDLPPAGDIIDGVRSLGWDGDCVAKFLETATDYKAAELADASSSSDGSESPEDGLTQSQLLIRFASKAALFHTPDGEAYACLPVGDHTEIWPVKNKSCRRWLTRAFYQAVGKPPGNQAMQDALGVLEARAQYDSPENQVFTRIAPYGDSIYIDLCNDKWEAVEITSKGWRAVQDPPVRFRRSKGMQPLPHPLPGGQINRLRSLINVGDDRNWVLLIAWLAAACRPQGPYPLLILQGEQGSAKSTTAKLLRRLIDPSTAPLRTPPREERDLVIAANNSWVIAYDNLSGIQPWLSDALCRLATGGGFSTRELYTDSDEVIFDLMRPVILNGIDHLAERPDLADRAIILNLPPIDGNARREEAELYREYEAERPYILGALFTAVSQAMAHLPKVRLPSKPRMADFAIWATAAEQALGFQSGAFMNAYAGNRAEAVQETLESDPVSLAILALMHEEQIDEQWTGTAKDLLQTLDAKVDDKVKKSQEWPKTARGLSGRLRRLATFLREVGIRVSFGPKGTGGRRPLMITRAAADSIATIATTAATQSSSPSNQSLTKDGPSGGRSW
jgi:hypothetical protein